MKQLIVRIVLATRSAKQRGNRNLEEGSSLFFVRLVLLHQMHDRSYVYYSTSSSRIPPYFIVYCKYVCDFNSSYTRWFFSSKIIIVFGKINEQEATNNRSSKTDKSSTNQFHNTLNTQVFAIISIQPSRRRQPRVKEVRTQTCPQRNLTTVNLNS